MTLSQKYLPIIRHFRLNSRIRLTDLSKKTRIPVSTLFEKLKLLEEGRFISKHTSLLNFSEMGYDIRTQLLLKATNTDELRSFLIKNNNVNSIYRINNGYDFLIEVVFENMGSFDEFIKQLNQFNVKKSEEFFVLEDIKREGFLEYNPLFN